MQIGDKKVDIREIFKAYYGTLSLFALRYVRDKEAASDVVQDAFLKLLESGKAYQNNDELKAFLYTVVRNMCLNSIRHQKIVNNYADSYVESPEHFRDVLIEEETARIIRTAILQLPPRSRQIMEYCLKGLSNQEIAELLRISINTIKTLKRQSYMLLRNKLRNVFIFTGLFSMAAFS